MNQIGSRTYKHIFRYYKNDIGKKEQKSDTEVVIFPGGLFEKVLSLILKDNI